MPTVEAKQLGDSPISLEEVAKWIDSGGGCYQVRDDGVESHCIAIQTSEGEKVANVGDYVVKEVDGGFYPYKKDLFEEIYEEM